MPRSAQATGRALWRARVDATPDRTFLRFGGRDRTFGDFDEQVRALAAGLAELGVRRGAPMLVAMGNRPETLQVQLALAELGAVCVPLLPGLTFDELAYPIAHSEARHLIADDTSAGTLLPRLGELPSLEHVVVTRDVAVEDGVAVRRLEELASAPAAPPRRLEGYDEDTLPRLANGKLDRVALQASLDLDSAWDARAAGGGRSG